MSKPIAALAILLAAAVAASPALALCQLCTADVRLDPGLAECLLKRTPTEMKAAAASPEGFVIVDLRDCQSRGGLPTGSAADGPPPALDARFVIDAAGLTCLSTQIQSLDDAAMTPTHVFNLLKDCPAQ